MFLHYIKSFKFKCHLENVLYLTMHLFLQMYLVIFPEGTRYNPELKNVISDSQAFAAKEGSSNVKNLYLFFAEFILVLPLYDNEYVGGSWLRCMVSSTVGVSEFTYCKAI